MTGQGGLGVVLSIGIKEKKGAPLVSVDVCNFIEGVGIENDQNGGKPGRQVSILSDETVKKTHETDGQGLCAIRFAPNIVVSGISIHELGNGAKLDIGGAELEITQVGKNCFPECELYQKGITCALASEIVFAKVLRGGKAKTGDAVRYSPEV